MNFFVRTIPFKRKFQSQKRPWFWLCRSKPLLQITLKNFVDLLSTYFFLESVLNLPFRLQLKLVQQISVKNIPKKTNSLSPRAERRVMHLKSKISSNPHDLAWKILFPWKMVKVLHFCERGSIRNSCDRNQNPKVSTNPSTEFKFHFSPNGGWWGYVWFPSFLEFYINFPQDIFPTEKISNWKCYTVHIFKTYPNFVVAVLEEHIVAFGQIFRLDVL